MATSQNTIRKPFVTRERQNWYIHLCFTRKDFPECLRVIEEQLKAANGQCEYPLYIKGNISLHSFINYAY